MYRIDQKRDLRLVPKLKDAHIDPTNAQRMKVKIAAQTLSRSVSAALRTLVEDGSLERSALLTADFVEKINDLFDLVNSSRLRSFQHQRPITKGNSSLKIDKMDTYISWIKQWRFQKNGKIFQSMPFQNGWVVTLSNMKHVVLNCLSDGFSYVCTRHFNQDCLEVCLFKSLLSLSVVMFLLYINSCFLELNNVSMLVPIYRGEGIIAFTIAFNRLNAFYY